MKYYILIAFFLVYQFNLSGRIKYDLLQNNGHIAIRILKFNIINLNFKIKNGYLEITDKKGKTKFMPLEIGKNKNQILESELELIILKRIHLKKLLIYFNNGFKDSAFFTSILTGFVNILSNCFLSYISSTKKNCKYICKTYCDYNKNVLKLGFKINFSITILDLLFSILEYIFANKIVKVKKIIQYK